MNPAAFAAALAIMLVGLAGTVLPLVPGIPLIYCGYLVYGLATSWQFYGAGTMIFWGVITCLTLVADFLGPMLGARRSSSSILGMWGSLAGSLIGLFVFGLPGLIIGTFAGAFTGELMARRPTGEALRAAKGALIGLLAGNLLKAMVGLIMVGAFVWQILIR